MATDTWTDGTANWDTPSDWSAGLPTASSDVVIDQGGPEVTASFGTIASIKINSTSSASLSFIDAGASGVTGGVTVKSGALYLDISSGDGGSSLMIGRRLTNDGRIQIGPDDNTLSADSTIEAASLSNRAEPYPGVIELFGSSTAQATLDVASAAGFGTAGTLTGSVNLSGDALVEFKAGQITTIAADSYLDLSGSHAFVADASNTGSNSALRDLDTVNGGLYLEDGAALKQSVDLANSGTIEIGGGSSLKVKGTLTNSGTIRLDGDGTVHATLNTPGAFTNDGVVELTDDYDKLAGPVGGTGLFQLMRHGKLEFGAGVSSGQGVDFFRVDKLILDQASSFDGTILDFFTKGDSVVAKTFAEAQTLLTYTQTGADSCSWTLTDGANTAVLNFAGEPYTKSDFSIASANNGAGLAIKFV